MRPSSALPVVLSALLLGVLTYVFLQCSGSGEVSAIPAPGFDSMAPPSGALARPYPGTLLTDRDAVPATFGLRCEGKRFAATSLALS